jgi:hypothetical protein
MKKILFALFALLFGATPRLEAQTPEPFPYQDIPLVFPNQASEAEWYALHFWDSYNFADPYRYDQEAFRRAFVDYVHALREVPSEVALGAAREMMHLAAITEESYWMQLEEAEIILYDPSSPLRNDLLWEAVMRHAIGPESPLDEVSKMRYVSMLTLTSRNQVGTRAANFTYTLPDGQRGSLHKIKAEYTLIYFYNPGCSECKRTKQAILASGVLEHLHRQGRLEVLAIYPDKEVDEWRRYLADNPSWWISAYDKERRLHHEELYDLKAIPTLYLLDSQKSVLLKDPTPEDLNKAIERIVENCE